MGYDERGLFEVLSPEGRSTTVEVAGTEAVGDLNRAVVGQVWDYMFRGDDVYEVLRETLTGRYPGIRFVDYTVFGNIHGPDQDALSAAIPRKLREHGCNAVLVGIGA